MKKSSIRSRVGVACMILGCVLIAGAVALLLYNRYEDAAAGASVEQVLPDLEQAIEEPASSAATLEIDGEEYMGILTIPALELELPVMSDWSYPKLKIAPCRYTGAAETNDLVICGHNYDRHFGRLKTLTAGDSVTFTGLDGKTIYYTVEAVEIVQPTDIDYMVHSDYDLTLYTCTYGGKTRVAVRCNRAK